MDKNTIIGFSLIIAIFLGWSYWMAPSEAELARQQHLKDSVELVQLEKEKAIAALDANGESALITAKEELSDSALQVLNTDKFGAFAAAATGSEKEIVIENNLLRVTLSNKGGKPVSVMLKEFQRHDSTTLVMFDAATSELGLKFFASNRSISTNEMYFELMESGENFNAESNEQVIRFRLKASDTKYIEYKYSLSPDSYLLGYNISFIGLEDILDVKRTGVDLHWKFLANSLERGDKWEKDNCDMNYKFYQDDVNNLGQAQTEDSETLSTRVRWIACKQQFFSSILIADKFIDEAVISYKRTDDTDSAHTTQYNSEMALSIEGVDKAELPFRFYFGPNKFSILKNIEVNEKEDLELERLIPYFGWGIGLVNRYVIIPVFSWLSGFNLSMGIIILLMTIMIKGVLFPFTYKSYVSMAEMRALKPQIDKISEKIPADKAMERQQATMALYKKAGVSPMGGCLPMLLQFPILIAMFRFFPASIELRGESFLWANDLSTYDVLFNLPFTIPFYGSHVSGFTLLMTFSSILTMKFGNTQMSSSNQMPGMQTMMYMMPVMFMVWFNSYSSGLSYYYFLSNIITFGQTMLIRQFTDEAKILERLEENKKKPVKQSKFQARLAEMAKKQQNNKK